MTTKKKPNKPSSAPAKNGVSLSDCNITLNMHADGATQLLAEALIAQASANRATACAIEQLSKTLKPIDVCAIKITNDGVQI